MKAAISLAAVMMIAGTVSVYASTPSNAHKELYNGVSATLIKAADKKPATIQDQINQLYVGLKPGQVIAYYVADQKFNPLNQIYFAGKGYVLKDYNEYMAKAKKMNAPLFTKPKDLPKGYKFKTGVLYLKNPDESSELYKKLDQELKAQAAQGNKSLYTKSLEVGEASSAVLMYVKDKVEVSVVSTFVMKSQPTNGTPVPDSNPNKITETIEIGGIECVYTTELKGKDHLDWTDTDNQVRYSIWAEGVKSDVVNFAKSMLKNEFISKTKRAAIWQPFLNYGAR